LFTGIFANSGLKNDLVKIGLLCTRFSFIVDTSIPSFFRVSGLKNQLPPARKNLELVIADSRK
jgi:hypothetical protein